jgi:hypothetical protein
MKLKLAFVLLCVAAIHAQDPARSGRDGGRDGLTIQVDGATKGTRDVLNLVPGNGIVQACVDNPASRRIDCTPSFNSAVISTHDSIHANENYCASTNGSIAYTCRLPYHELTGYRAGMTFLLVVDNTCATSCNLNIDGRGSVSIKKIDGTTDPRGTLIAGQPQWIFYDGKIFRLMGGLMTPDGRGDLTARRVIGTLDVMTYASAMTLDVTAGDMHKITTIPAIGNATINAGTGGLPGQHMWIIIANDPMGARTIAFGSNLRSAGALTGAPNRSATIHFISDGVAWYEVARTANL